MTASICLSVCLSDCCQNTAVCYTGTGETGETQGTGGTKEQVRRSDLFGHLFGGGRRRSDISPRMSGSSGSLIRMTRGQRRKGDRVLLDENRWLKQSDIENPRRSSLFSSSHGRGRSLFCTG